MKKYSGNRAKQNVKMLVMQSGGRFAPSASTASDDADLWLNIEFKGIRFIWNHWNGKFIVPAAEAKKAFKVDRYVTEADTDLDGHPIYKAILDLLYVSKEEAAKRVVKSKPPEMQNIKRN